MSLVRSLAVVVILAFLSAGCRYYDIYRPDLQRVAQGERFIETHGTLNPMPTVVTLRERETITLYDENGNELRTTTVAALKPADAEKATIGQIWRYNEHRVGWVVGAILGSVVVTVLILGLTAKPIFWVK